MRRLFDGDVSGLRPEISVEEADKLVVDTTAVYDFDKLCKNLVLIGVDSGDSIMYRKGLGRFVEQKVEIIERYGIGYKDYLSKIAEHSVIRDVVGEIFADFSTDFLIPICNDISVYFLNQGYPDILFSPGVSIDDLEFGIHLRTECYKERETKDLVSCFKKRSEFILEGFSDIVLRGFIGELDKESTKLWVCEAVEGTQESLMSVLKS
ncbi:MAG: hypothetical protein GOU97_03940 [Nanoarchaeota archaeon]|nr:hypothetical protein [Nanoarchaeota archaeon]